MTFCWLLALASSCGEPDLSDALSKGRCDSHGQCAKGYTCVNDQCEKPGAGGSGGQAGSGPCDGECPVACNPPCPGTTCENGTCTNQCLPGFLDCDKNVITGCEVHAGACPSADAGAD